MNIIRYREEQRRRAAIRKNVVICLYAVGFVALFVAMLLVGFEDLTAFYVAAGSAVSAFIGALVVDHAKQDRYANDR